MRRLLHLQKKIKKKSINRNFTTSEFCKNKKDGGQLQSQMLTISWQVREKNNVNTNTKYLIDAAHLKIHFLIFDLLLVLKNNKIKLFKLK
jgi:hypothetical protein